MTWTRYQVSQLPPAQQTCDAYGVNNTSTTITLVAPSSVIIIVGDPNVATYVNFRNTTCTTGNLKIAAGAAFRYTGAALQQFTMISSSGTANVQIQAN